MAYDPLHPDLNPGPEPGSMTWPPPEWTQAPEPTPGFDPEGFPATDPFVAAMGAETQGGIPEAQTQPELGVDPFVAAMESQQESAAKDEFVPVPRETFDGQTEQATLGAPVLQAPKSYEYLRAADPELAEPFEPLAPAYETEDLIDEYDRMSPEALALRMAREDQNKRDFVNARRQEFLDEDRKQKELVDSQLAQARQEADLKAAELERDVQEYSEKGIDQSRWSDSQPTFNKIAMVLSAGMGGFLEVMGSGRNTMTPMVMNLISQDIASQKADLARHGNVLGRRQSLLGDMYERIGDIEQAEKAARIVRLNQAAEQLAIEIEQYDTNGTAARQGFKGLQELRANQARAAADFRESARKKYIEGEELRIKQEDMRTRRGKANIETAAAAKKAGLIWSEEEQGWVNAPSRGGGGSGQKFPPEYYKKVFGVDVPFAMSQKDFKDYLSTKKSAQGLNPQVDEYEEAKTRKEKSDAKLKGIEANAGPGGNPYAIGDHTGAPLRNKDNSIFAVPDTTLRAKLGSMYSAGLNIRRIADLAKILRAKSGGASEIIGSPEYQELKSLAAGLDFETYKAFDLGAPSAGDAQMAEDARGGKDITSWIYDASKGWDAYANNVENKLDAHFRIEGGYTGPKIKMPRKKVKSDEERTIQTIEKDLLSERLEGEDEAEFLRDKRRDMAVWLKRNPSKKEMTSLAQKLSENPSWSDEDAANLVFLMGPRYDTLTKSDAEKMKDSLKKPFDDKTIPDSEAIYRRILEGK